MSAAIPPPFLVAVVGEAALAAPWVDVCRCCPGWDLLSPAGAPHAHFETLAAVLAEAVPEAVVICSPPSELPERVIEALAADLHVTVEDLSSSNPDEVDRCAAIAGNRGLVILTAPVEEGAGALAALAAWLDGGPEPPRSLRRNARARPPR